MPLAKAEKNRYEETRLARLQPPKGGTPRELLAGLTQKLPKGFQDSYRGARNRNNLSMSRVCLSVDWVCAAFLRWLALNQEDGIRKARCVGTCNRRLDSRLQAPIESILNRF